MDKEFYIRKIRQLSNEKLKELFQYRTKENQEIMALAEKEAVDRGIDPESLNTAPNNARRKTEKTKNEKGITWKDILGDILSGL